MSLKNYFRQRTRPASVKSQWVNHIIVQCIRFKNKLGTATFQNGVRLCLLGEVEEIVESEGYEHKLDRTKIPACPECDKMWDVTQENERNSLMPFGAVTKSGSFPAPAVTYTATPSRSRLMITHTTKKRK